MTDTTYSVVFNGELLGGFDREQVKSQFAVVFRLDNEKVDKIFSRKRVVLKKELPLGAAQRYIKTLRGIGLRVVLEPSGMDVPPENKVDSAPKESPYSTLFNRAHNAPQPPASQGLGPVNKTNAGTAASLSALELVPIDKPSSDAPEGKPSQQAKSSSSQQNLPMDLHPEVKILSMTSSDYNEYDFSFNGRGGEYFRIWIVNIALTILTLGIYSAWAKVRTERYFYGNTFLDDNSFEYLADPIRILKGRIILFLFVVIYVGTGLLDNPIVTTLVAIIITGMVPWIVTRAITFRNHNSAWRGIRFGFDGNTMSAVIPYLGLPLISGLAFPFWPFTFFMQKKFMVTNSRFGTKYFDFHASAGEFYKIFLLLIFISVGLFFFVIYLAVTGSSILSGFLFPFLLIGLWSFLYAYYKVKMANLVYNNTTLGNYKLGANYDLLSYFLLVLTNTLFTILTLGFFRPWAMVRTARYRAEHTSIIATDSLDKFVSRQQPDVSAVGAEFGDFFSFDIGF